MLTALVLAALAAAPAAPSAAGRPDTAPRTIRLAPPDLRPLAPHPSDTHCEKCHTTDGWGDVAFAHERTGFPLRGAHVRATCKSCHATSFTQALGRDCSACHRDVHQGRLGARCSGCHEETDWKTRFDADAHRRGNFPLTGRHAFIPCQECHGDRRDRGFARTTPECLACHAQDYARARSAALPHGGPGFDTRCQHCHQPWRFRGAGFPQHEACFPISSGHHAGIACGSCHSGIPAFLGGTLACSSGTASCTRCHSCSSHPAQIGGPPQNCSVRKCYECHPGGVSPQGLGTS
ncbi:MAG TPA: cytochrome C, partial [Anaeromyxobacteraceae bacterium]